MTIEHSPSSVSSSTLSRAAWSPWKEDLLCNLGEEGESNEEEEETRGGEKDEPSDDELEKEGEEAGASVAVETIGSTGLMDVVGLLFDSDELLMLV